MTCPPDSPARTVTRRGLLLLGVGAFAVAGLPWLRRRRAVRRTVPVMGTFADLVVVHANPVYAHAALTAAVDELRRVERLMTRFRDDSDVGRLNRAAGGPAVAVAADTATVLRRARHWADASDGVFDPCLGRLTGAYDAGRAPAEPVRARLAGQGLFRALAVDDRRARLALPEAAVDLGGIAKGFGVDCAAATLRAWGVAGGLVNAGGDLYALGHGADGGPWQIGIRNPDGGGIVGSFPLADAAAATSGDYLRPTHLLDPATGRPAQAGARSVTVVADSCLDADAAATLAFALPPETASHAVARGAREARIVSRI